MSKKHTTILALLSLGLFLSCAKPKTIYVKQDATGTQTGDSWENAITDIQAAIDVAAEGDVLWIASGIYHPKNPLGYQITKGIELVGGFKGDELKETDRKYTDSLIVDQVHLRYMKNVTGFNGDLKEDDNFSKWNYSTLTDASSTSQPWSSCHMQDNSKHLIKIVKDVNSPVVIRGITFENSLASAVDGEEGDGGVIYNEGKHFRLENCWIYRGFSTTRGGGIFSIQAQPKASFTLKNTFIVNSFSKWGGAYCVLSKQGDVEIVGNLINRCNASNEGGGGVIYYDTPIDEDSGILKIKNNSIGECSAFLRNSNSYGGGLYVKADVVPKNEEDTLITISGNSFWKCSVDNKNLETHNSEASGGGLYFSTTHRGKGTFDLVENNSFDKCDAFSRQSKGGGVYLEGPVLFKNNRINKCFVGNNNNKADKYSIQLKGGGIYSVAAILQGNNIKNCICRGGQGGGLYLGTGQLIDSEVINCSAKNGGGIFMYHTSYINNTLIANNQASERGGGIYADMHVGTKKRITRSTIVANKARRDGGAVALQHDVLFLENIVYGNSYKRPTSVWGKPQWGWGQQVECVNICGPTRVTIASCALEGYSSGGNDNISLAHYNKPSKKRKGYFPYFKHPSKVLGAVNPWGLETKSAKNKYKKIQEANWEIEELSSCGDYGYHKELHNPELKTGKIF